MTTLAYPILPSGRVPNQFGWKLYTPTQVMTSPLNGAVQTLELPGARWMANIGYNDLDEEDAAVLEAWLVTLRGRSGRFHLHNFGRAQVRGTASGSPSPQIANDLGSPAGAQSGVDIWADGFGSSATLVAGDMIEFSGELHMIRETCTATVGGAMRLALCFPVRTATTDNAQIALTRAAGTFMLASDEVEFVKTPGVFTDVRFDAIEAFA